MICDIISRLHCRNTDYIIFKFHEYTFVRHEFCKTNLLINFTFEPTNNTRGFTQTMHASIQREVSGIVSKEKGKFMYIHAHLLHSIIIDLD